MTISELMTIGFVVFSLSCIGISLLLVLHQHRKDRKAMEK